MIDLKATNEKLQQRSRNIIRQMCGLLSPKSDEGLDAVLAACEGSVKLAVATILLQTSIPEAKGRLEDAHGILADVLKDLNNTSRDSSAPNGGELDGYVLCVDGGGSKCAAVVFGKNGEIGRGEAGECNL